MSTYSNWLIIGFVGQGLFTARFVVQWMASEREGRVVVPSAFWWLSLLGAALLFSYAISRGDPVFAVGQSIGVFIYIRNLMIGSRKGERPEAAPAAGSLATLAPHFRAEAAAETIAGRT
ncbi:lipid-A-disaccharide synthase N-terminal domain-containing protein [Planctomyces sp. SH-PL62]|uniref:lipid-A-disaccharide synthase N-terminal domain-containing protein n=1 Tax=Planctomyces sp. SH-PL62 TaxID=1636152 RepID=UPI0009EF1A7C|nr:lipid-A-disaccharide synthase N-terminal domain-containing protein [Planctomyces sp. SH-PL62]